jgi:uncharacterized protein (DUF1810 family)
MADPFDLERFVRAQDPMMPDVLRELGDGRKRSHWMWFVFPQLRDLGRSPTALRYGIASLGEAQAYLAHPVLGARLIQCTELMTVRQDRSAHDIFGSPDDLKFRSSMSLFASAQPQDGVFVEALRRYFGGLADPRTVELLSGSLGRASSMQRQRS